MGILEGRSSTCSVEELEVGDLKTVIVLVKIDLTLGPSAGDGLRAVLNGLSLWIDGVLASIVIEVAPNVKGFLVLSAGEVSVLRATFKDGQISGSVDDTGSLVETGALSYPELALEELIVLVLASIESPLGTETVLAELRLLLLGPHLLLEWGLLLAVEELVDKILAGLVLPLEVSGADKRVVLPEDVSDRLNLMRAAAVLMENDTLVSVFEGVVIGNMATSLNNDGTGGQGKNSSLHGELINYKEGWRFFLYTTRVAYITNTLALKCILAI